MSIVVNGEPNQNLVLYHDYYFPHHLLHTYMSSITIIIYNVHTSICTYAYMLEGNTFYSCFINTVCTV